MAEDLNERTIKFQVVVGVTHGGGWCVADQGDSIPLGIEYAIDRVWEGISGDDSLGDGYEIYILDVELPRPVRHAPPHAKAPDGTPAVRVDSKDAVLRGRSEALQRVLQVCALDDDTAAQIRDLLGDVDDDWGSEKDDDNHGQA